MTEIFWNLPLISRESQHRISFIYWLNYFLETRQIGDSQKTAYYIKGGGCKQNALCGFIKVVYFAKVVKFHVLYSFVFFLYFITVSGNYRWINMFQMMVYRMFCAGFLRIFIFGICYQKSEMTHNPVFFLTWFSLYFICNIDDEIALNMKYDYNYYQEKKLIVCWNKACCKYYYVVVSISWQSCRF